MKKILETIVSVVLFLILVMGVVLFMLSRPKTISSSMSNSGIYMLEFMKKEPEIIFGNEKVRIVLKRGSQEIFSEETSISNNGKSLSEKNWKVDWQGSFVIVTLSGEEQEDEEISFFYTRRFIKYIGEI